MITAYCRTNLDDYRGTMWPDRFAALPRVGDLVEGIGSNRSEMTRPVLKVVSVTHKVDRDGEPLVCLELHR